MLLLMLLFSSTYFGMWAGIPSLQAPQIQMRRTDGNHTLYESLSLSLCVFMCVFIRECCSISKLTARVCDDRKMLGDLLVSNLSNNLNRYPIWRAQICRERMLKLRKIEQFGCEAKPSSDYSQSCTELVSLIMKLSKSC